MVVKNPVGPFAYQKYDKYRPHFPLPRFIDVGEFVRRRDAVRRERKLRGERFDTTPVDVFEQWRRKLDVR